MQERRRNTRTPSYLGGVISFRQQRCSLECLVRNISRDGAKITFSNATIVPAEFNLDITAHQQAFRAQAIWRSATEMGIKLLNAEKQPSVAPMHLIRRLKACRAENAALRRRLVQLTSD